MGGMTSDWKDELERFLKPFLDRLGHKARRQMCPLVVAPERPDTVRVLRELR